MLSWAADVALLTAVLHELRSRVTASSSVSLSSSDDDWWWLSFDVQLLDKFARFSWLLQIYVHCTVSQKQKWTCSSLQFRLHTYNVSAGWQKQASNQSKVIKITASKTKKHKQQLRYLISWSLISFLMRHLYCVLIVLLDIAILSILRIQEKVSFSVGGTGLQSHRQSRCL